MNVFRLLKRPPSSLPRIAKRMAVTEAMKLVQHLDFVCERAAEYSAYLQEACGVYGCGHRDHADALKAFNEARRKVRGALGFTYTDTITF